MSTLMLFGAACFFSGSLLFMILLFGNGGAARSRQFAVIGALASGRLGRGRRLLLIAAFCLAGLGAAASFGGVAAIDAARAQHCREHCVARGFAAGTIGPSLDRSAPNRFVACTCTSPDQASLELRADSIPP